MYVIMWEFAVRPDKVDDFITAYKAGGDWAQLFGLGEGFEGTELLPFTDCADRFLTIDRWRSVDHFALFQEQFSEEYRNLDRRLEGLTLNERRLGTFTTAG